MLILSILFTRPFRMLKEEARRIDKKRRDVSVLDSADWKIKNGHKLNRNEQ
jgi:hypothetical protein